MTPSVGRIVHYSTRGTADGAYPSTCRAAIVTDVTDNFTIDLAVLFPTAIRFELDVREDPDWGGHSWHWPERVE